MLFRSPTTSSITESSSGASSALPSSSVTSSNSSQTVSTSDVVSSSETSSETIGPWTVSFDAQGGEDVDAQSVEHNGLLTEPDTFYGLMLLSGWYTSADDGVTLDTRWEFDEDIVTEDLTLYAFWTTPLITDYDVMDLSPMHAMALDDRGYPYGWGGNFTGTIGNGFQFDVSSPTISNLSNFEENEFVIHLSTSLTHTLYLTNLGNVYASGLNDSYAFGLDATTVPEYLIPTKIPLNLPEEESLLNIWASNHTSWILTESGRLFMAGTNTDNLSGVNRPDLFYIETFQEVTFPAFADDEVVIDGFFGHQQYFVLSNLGNVYAWGLDDSTGALGVGDDVYMQQTPTLITFSNLQPREFVIDLAIYEDTTLALTNQNRLFGWGEADDGQLTMGDDAKDVYYHPTLLDLTFLSDGETITAFTSGRRHGGFITSLGHVYQFGDNSNQQLGIADRSDRFEAVLLDTSMFNPGEKASYIQAGNDWTLIVTTEGRWFGIGDNANNYVSYDSNIPDVGVLTLIQILD